MLFDSHCHLDSQSPPFPKGMIMVTAGYSVGSSKKNLEIARSNQGVYCCVGIAPQEAQKFATEAELEAAIGKIEGIIEIKDPKIVAIGEIGLDFHWAKDELQKEMQRKCFGAMLAIANERNLPVVVHCREAMSETLRMLEISGVRFMMHCFSGSEEEAKRALDMGGMISIPPLRSKGRKKVIKLVALERLVAETDSPAIGKTPGAVRESVAMIAEHRGITPDLAENAVYYNACRFFGIGGGNHA